jgi:hypothetical protein
MASLARVIAVEKPMQWTGPDRGFPAGTVLGDAVHPYLDRIAENAANAREAAQAMADVRRSPSMPLPPARPSYP